MCEGIRGKETDPHEHTMRGCTRGDVHAARMKVCGCIRGQEQPTRTDQLMDRTVLMQGKCVTAFVATWPQPARSMRGSIRGSMPATRVTRVQRHPRQQANDSEEQSAVTCAATCTQPV